MANSLATSIFHKDVVILGGGIAGIAIAEMLSRRTDLSIKVLDQAPLLGMGASSKLEGWFHSGALYSGNEDPQTFLNCLNALEDLINHYSTLYPEQCNIGLKPSETNVYLPTVQTGKNTWFNNATIHYILPNHTSPDLRFSRLKNDPMFINLQRQKVLSRLQKAYGGNYNWLKDEKCLAPTLETIDDYSESDFPLHNPPEVLRALTRRFDASYELPDSGPTFVNSSDVPLNSAAIMRDLVANALSRGVEFETNIQIQSMVLERYGPLRIKSLLCHNGNGQPMNLRAKLFILAVGSGFAQQLSDLNLRVRLKTNRSSMVVVYPSLCSVNFARMSINSKFHFNHLQQTGIIDKKPVSYSMLANSGFSTQDSSSTQEVESVDILLGNAERYFGNELYTRKLFSYDCTKTEFISDEEEKRRYSYWIESPSGGNYLCILPGKFSFFPTVAHQVHLKVKSLLDLKDSAQIPPHSPSHSEWELANRLVADHYPLRILKEDWKSMVEEGTVP